MCVRLVAKHANISRHTSCPKCTGGLQNDIRNGKKVRQGQKQPESRQNSNVDLSSMMEQNANGKNIGWTPI